MKKVCVVVGTRPEAIKMAPVILALKDRARAGSRMAVFVCVTAQHRGMLDEVLQIFGINPDFDLDVMERAQDLTDVTCKVLSGMRGVLRELAPTQVLVHGDTTTTLSASLAAYYERVSVAHVEAGLRTGNPYAPWPEEINRRLTGAIAELHFAPTQRARANLIREGVDSSKIHITGNTVIDALKWTTEKLRVDAATRAAIETRYSFLRTEKRLILVTGHRRENFGEGLASICRALTVLARRGDVEIIYAAHPNPNVRGPVNALLTNHSSIHVIDPPDYLSFVYLMERAYLILSDSGGIQEEAPTLSKPVLVTRSVTERPEGVEVGAVKLVGTDEREIERAISRLMDDGEAYRAMAGAGNPYGDGHAAQRVADVVTNDAY